MELSSPVIAAIEDLLTEILIRLPVKSLLRFKSVSKEWLSLITSPQFRDLKSKRFSKDISGILWRRCRYSPVGFNSVYEVSSNSETEYNYIPVGESYLRRLNFDGAQGKLEVVQHCNGLLLCCDSNGIRFRDRTYYMLNPITKDCTALPLNRIPDWPEIRNVNLAFDPRKSHHYKLICIYRSNVGEGEYTDRFAIYSSETGLLRKTDVDVPFGAAGIVYNRGLYWNGAINWIDYDKDGLYFNIDEERVGLLPTVRVESENPFELFPHPFGDDYNYQRRRWIRYFEESNDHLHLIHTCLDTPSSEFDVYEMDRGYSGWSVRFHVDLQPVLSSFSYFRSEKYPLWHNQFVKFPEQWHQNANSMFDVLAVVEKDDGESFLVISTPGKAVRVNLKDMSSTRLCDREYGGYWGSIRFVESLARVQF